MDAKNQIFLKAKKTVRGLASFSNFNEYYDYNQNIVNKINNNLFIVKDDFIFAKDKCLMYENGYGFFVGCVKVMKRNNQGGHHNSINTRKNNTFMSRYGVDCVVRLRKNKEPKIKLSFNEIERKLKLLENYEILDFKGYNKLSTLKLRGETFKANIKYILFKKVTWTPSEMKEVKKQTCIERYGQTSPSKNLQVQLKSARTSNKRVFKTHWKTGAELVCVGGYEAKCVDYFNSNSIDFHWQPMGFNCSNGKVYFVDCYFPEQDKYIEIKGYFRDDAKQKFDEFCSVYPKTELWNKEKLKQLKIL